MTIHANPKRYTVERVSEHECVLTVHADCLLGFAGDEYIYWRPASGGYCARRECGNARLEATMATYTVSMRDDGGSTETTTVEHETGHQAEVVAMAEQECRDWAEGGEWGHEGASVDVRYTITDEFGTEVYESSILVEIPANEEAMVREAGGDPDCAHVWSGEGHGGLVENPGVYGHGGGVVISEHCRLCGAQRRTDTWADDGHGGHCERVTYEAPADDFECEPSPDEEA